MNKAKLQHRTGDAQIAVFMHRESNAWKRPLIHLFLGLICVMTVCPPLLTAQAVSGTLLGYITDPTGAVVPEAKVTIVEQNKGVTRSIETDNTGNYEFPQLPPGVYVVVVEHPGFKKAARDGVDVLVDSDVRVNMMLQPGGPNEIVTVSSETATLQTDRADLGTKIVAEQIEDLPMAYNRNFQSLINLVPGSTRAHREQSAFFNAQDSLRVELNGQSGLSNNLQLEGIDDNERSGLLQIYIPPAEAIETIDVSTSNYDAELGRATGAVTNIILKSGTNSFHGGLYEINRTNTLAAVPYFQNTTVVPKSPSVYNYFGAYIGGPIKKDRLFFFFDILHISDHEHQFFQSWVPPEPFRNGDFTGVPSFPVYDPRSSNNEGARTQIACSITCPLNPQTGQPYAAGTPNTVDFTRIDPAVKAILAKVPFPNLPGASLTSSTNFQGTTKFEKDSTSVDVKLDGYMTDRDHISGRFSFENQNLLQTPIYGLVGGPANGGFSGTGTQRIWNTATDYTHVLSLNKLVELRVGVNHYRNVANNTDRGHTTADEIGITIPGANLGDLNSSGMPCINLPGIAPPGSIGCLVGYSASLPWVRGETNIDAANIWTIIHATHTVKWGFDVRRLRDDLAQWQSENPRGLFTFTDTVTSKKGGPTPSDQVNGFASFLLDMPNLVGRDIPNNSKSLRATELFIYVQDTWQAAKNLTLTPGLRWEFYPPFTPKAPGRFSNYDPSANDLVIAGVGANPLNLGRRVNYANLAPRLGVAYRLGTDAVLRAGVGISYSPYPDNDYAFDYPVLQNNVFSGVDLFKQARTSSGTPLSLLSGFPPPVVATIPPSGIVPVVPSPHNVTSLLNQSYTAVNLHFREPHIVFWNIAIQRSLPAKFVVDVAYVGNHGVDLPTIFNLNASTVPGSGTEGRPLFERYGLTGEVPFKYVGTSSNYGALQVRCDRRFSGGVAVTIAYTLGKSLGFKTDGGSLGINSTVGSLADYIGGDLRRNYSLLEYDRRHVFVNSIIYELPFGRGKPLLPSGFGNKVLGGWKLSSLITMMSGSPLVFSGGSALDAPGNQQVPNFTGVFQVLHGVGQHNPWFNTAAFSKSTDGTLGNAPRVAFGGPGLFNLDASVSRRFSFREGLAVEIRADSFSVSNTPQFSNPVTNFNSSSFGRVINTRPAPYGGNRSVELGAKISF